MAMDFKYPDVGESVPQWAREETQLQVLSVLQREKGVSGKSTKALEDLTKATKKEVKMSEKAADALADVASFSGTLAGTLATTKGEFKDLIPIVDNFGKMFAKVGGTLLKAIPLVGDALAAATGVATELATDVFSFIATSADELIASYRDVAQQGITFEGNLQDMQAAGAGAIMSLDQLDGLFQQAIPTLTAFGNATEGGKQVLKSLSQLWTADGLGDQLVRMGFSIEQVNETAVGFYNLLAKSGQAMMLQAGNEEVLAAATGRYTKNLLVISKLTGRQREELESDIRAQMEQGNIQASLALLEGKAGEDSILAFQQLQGVLTTMSPQLATAFGSIATLGVASAESEALLATLGGSTRDLMDEFGEGFRAGTLSKEDANRLTQSIMDDLSEGFLRQDTLGLAQIGTDVTGGFLQMLAKNMETAIPFAQSIKAGASLDELAAQITEEMKDQASQAATLADAQKTLANFPIQLQAAIVSTEAFEKTMLNVANVTDKFVGVLTKILTGKGLGGADVDAIEKDLVKSMNIKKVDGIYLNQDSPAKTKGEKIVGNAGTISSVSQDNNIARIELENFLYDNKTEDDLNAFKGWWNKKAKTGEPTTNEMVNWLKDKGLLQKSFQLGTKGIVDFGAGTLAMLHGKEAVIPAPDGMIPVDLGDTLKPLEDLLANLTSNTGPGNNLLAQDGVNSVQSKEVVSKLNEMIGVLRTIADGQYTGSTMFGKEIRRLGNQMSEDLFR